MKNLNLEIGLGLNLGNWNNVKKNFLGESFGR